MLVLWCRNDYTNFIGITRINEHLYYLSSIKIFLKPHVCYCANEVPKFCNTIHIAHLGHIRKTHSLVAINSCDCFISELNIC